MNDELTPTSGATWRKDYTDGITVRLPSGNVVRMRPVSMRFFIEAGTLPDILTPLVEQLINTNAMRANTVDDYKKMDDMMVALCKAAFRYPKVVDNPEADDEIGPEHLSDEDKRAVLDLLGGGAQKLRTFHYIEESLVEGLEHLSRHKANAE